MKKNDIKMVVGIIIDDNERMKREDQHDRDEKIIDEEVMVEHIMDYIEESKCTTLPLNLLVGVRRALIKEGYTLTK